MFMAQQQHWGDKGSTPIPMATPYTAVNSRKAVKLPDGISFIEVDLSYITMRGPTGLAITSPAPPIPNFEEEETTKPILYKSSRVGQCKKLAYKKRFGKTKWNERTIKLENNIISWNDKKQVSRIELKSGVVIEEAEANSPKRRDAHDTSGMISMMTTPMAASHVGEVGKYHCIAIHVPADAFANMDLAMNIANQTPFQMMKTMSTNKISEPITHYFHFSTEVERDSWEELMLENLQAAISQNFVPYQFYKNLAKQAGIQNVESLDWKAILTALYEEQLNHKI